MNLAFEDKDSRKDISAMRKAENIHHFAEASDLFEFYYDEKSGGSVVRCFPCFEQHCQSKQHLKSMPPLKAQQKLNPSGNGNLGTGLFYPKDTTNLLIKGNNKTWANKRNNWIDHFTLLGQGSATHKKAMETYRKVQHHESRKMKTATNIFVFHVFNLFTVYAPLSDANLS